MQALLATLTAVALVAAASTPVGAMPGHHPVPPDPPGVVAPPPANELPPTAGGFWDPPMALGIQAIHSIHLPTDKVMLWAYDGASSTIPIRIYDRPTQTLTDAQMPKAAFCAGHAHLPDGRVVIYGGRGLRGGGHYTIYDPFAATFSAPKATNARRYYPTLTSTPDGRVITFSGSGGGARTPEVYDPSTDTWTRLGCPPGASQSTHCRDAYINIHWYARTAFNAQGVLFTIPASRDNWGFSFDLAAERWTRHEIGPLRDGKIRGGPAVYYASGRMLRAGADKNARSTASAEAAVIDFSDALNPTYRAVVPMAFARTRNSLTLLPDGTVLATGGIRTVATGEDAHVYHAELWDPATETWTTLNAMTNHRVYHSTAILLRDATVLSAGGENKQKTAQIFHPPYLFQGSRPVITSAPADVYYAEPFDVLTSDPASIAAVNLVKLGAATHTYDESQLIARLGFTPAADRVIVDGPATYYEAPPGYYMLFLISNQGVPSVAEYVKVEEEEYP